MSSNIHIKRGFSQMIIFFLFILKIYYNYMLRTIVHTVYFTILQERYHEVQDVMTTPWPLT